MSLRSISFLRRALAAAAICSGLPFAADLVPAPALLAQAPAAKPAEPGWVQLFNGKDLTGWVYGTKKDKAGAVAENKAGAGYQVKEGGGGREACGDGGHGGETDGAVHGCS